MSGAGLLVLRRRGALWGVAENSVVRIAHEGATTLVETTAGELVADEVVGRAVGLRVAALGSLTSGLLRDELAGLGVHQGNCLLVVDPTRPPGALRRADDTPPPPRGATRKRQGERTHGPTER